MQTWKLTELKVKDGARRQPKLCNRRLEKKQAPSSYSPTHTMNFFWPDNWSNLGSEVFLVIGPVPTIRTSIRVVPLPKSQLGYYRRRSLVSFVGSNSHLLLLWTLLSRGRGLRT
jgi:hypothetical protein